MADRTLVIEAAEERRPRRVGGAWLLLALAAGPIAWGMQFAIGYALVSDTCFPGPVLRVPAANTLAGIWWVQFAVEAAAIALALVSVLLSARIWRHRSG